MTKKEPTDIIQAYLEIILNNYLEIIKNKYFKFSKIRRIYQLSAIFYFIPTTVLQYT